MSKKFNRDIELTGSARIVKNGSVIVDGDGNIDAPITPSLASGKIYVGNASGVAAAVDVSGDATISNTGALTIASGAVESSMLAPNAITPSTISSYGEGDGQVGIEKVWSSTDSATIKALLDGSANALNTNFPVGAYISDFLIWTQTAAGSAGTVKVGTDANWNDASNDDAFVLAFDLNAPGTYRMSRLDAGTTPAAPSALAGIFASGTADLTIQSSADLSASSWVGGIKIWFVV